MSRPSCGPSLIPKKQNPPSQRFWRGGIRELSDFLLLSSLVPSTPERVQVPRRLGREFGVDSGYSYSYQEVHRWYRSQRIAASAKSCKPRAAKECSSLVTAEEVAVPRPARPASHFRACQDRANKTHPHETQESFLPRQPVA